jgi:large conductance mechanosensitive channel
MEGARPVKKFAYGFREFVLRGNVVDLAVAVVVGAAFNALVQSFASNVLLQIVAVFFGNPNFDRMYWTVNHAVIGYGKFLTALVSFIITAFAVYIVVFTYNELQERRRRGEVEEPAEPPSDEAKLLAEIRDLLKAQRGG